MLTHTALRRFSLRASCLLATLFICVVAHTQSAPVSTAPASPLLLQKMVGTWKVQQRMWTGYGAAPTVLPPAQARRRLIGNIFLEEAMELEPGSQEQPFTRTAYFNFNSVNQQYEYVSLDTRAPQVMNERGSKSAQGTLSLQGSRFVAPQWGKATQVAFTYRLTVGPVEKDTQVVRLLFTPQVPKRAKEFLAFEYTYTRQP